LPLNTGQNHKERVANKLFEGVAKVKYSAKQIKIGFTKELRADQIRGMLALIQFRIFCLLLCSLKEVRIKIYKTMILPLIFYGCETWH
jgi:hypothetical protein